MKNIEIYASKYYKFPVGCNEQLYLTNLRIVGRRIHTNNPANGKTCSRGQYGLDT